MSTLSYGFRNITQFLQLCYELLTMYIIITNTQKFLHYTEEATITAPLSMMSVKWMRLCKTHKLVLSQKNTSKQHCYGIQLSATNSIASRSMGGKKNHLYFLNITIHLLLRWWWGMWLVGFYLVFVLFFYTIFTFLQSSGYSSSNKKKQPTWKEGIAYFFLFWLGYQWSLEYTLHSRKQHFNKNKQMG